MRVKGEGEWLEGGGDVGNWETLSPQRTSTAGVLLWGEGAGEEICVVIFHIFTISQLYCTSMNHK